MATSKNEKLMAQTERVIFSTYGRLPVALVKGEGTTVTDADGNEYLDFTAGLAVNNLGYCHPTLIRAVRAQLRNIWHCSNLYYHEPQIKLARKLTQISFGQKVFFCNSGAEACEGAIKLARYWARCTHGEGRHEIVAADGSFHGRTYGSLSATGQPKYHNGFEPMLPGFRHVPFGDAAALEQAVSKQTAAILLEPIQGEGGVNVPPPGYLQAARQIADKNSCLLIFDEVQTGIARTGKWFCHQWDESIQPDVMTLSKALGNGLPIGAIVARNKVAKVWQPGHHASTFGGNPVAAAAGIAVLKTIEKEGILEKTIADGEYLREELRGLATRYPLITEVRGRGLMCAAQLGRPWPEITREFLSRGILVNNIGGSILRMVPPLVVTREEIDRFIQTFEDILKTAP